MKDTEIKKISDYLSISIEEIKKVLAEKKKEINQKPKKENFDKEAPRKFYFLENDLKKLELKIETLHNEIARLGKEIGRSCDESGETFHDNFDYEECSRQQTLWSGEIKKLTEIKRKSKIVVPSKEEKKVFIGKKVKILKNGEKFSFYIGSYMSFTKNYISYKSPIASLIFGAKEGETKEGIINGKKTVLEIISIE